MPSLLDGEGVTPKIFLAAALIAVSLVATRLFNAFRLSQALSKYPIVNEKWDAEAKKQFAESAASIMEKGVAMVGSLPRKS